jgi:hypothetical protein
VTGRRGAVPIRLRRPLLALVAGTLLAVGVPAGWALVASPAGIGQIGGGTAASLAGPAGAPSARAGVPTRVGSAATLIPVSGPGGEITGPARLPAPVRIVIASLSIDAPVLAEGVDPSGAMAIPQNVQETGWYRWGPAPGSAAGSIVVVGHVDSASQGVGAFFALDRIADSAVITLVTADHRVWRYRVVAREEIAKPLLPSAAVFGRTGPVRLTLATCGGAFDPHTKSYKDNIIVTAVPL